ncbi:Uncharacterised protein g808 [Pycnogonum litorale]
MVNLKFIILCALLAIIPNGETTSKRKNHVKRNKANDQPYFDEKKLKLLDAAEGGHIKMVCAVNNVGNREVKWIRVRDRHAISNNGYIITQDDRFSVVHRRIPGKWMLFIKHLRFSDDGLYECRVDGTSPLVHRRYRLRVRVPTAKFLQGQTHHVTINDTLTLDCRIDKNFVKVEVLFWYHNNTIISSNYNERIEISTRNKKQSEITTALTVRSIKWTDSGIYTCSPNNGKAASITVVVNGCVCTSPKTSCMLLIFVGFLFRLL